MLKLCQFLLLTSYSDPLPQERLCLKDFILTPVTQEALPNLKKDIELFYADSLLKAGLYQNQANAIMAAERTLEASAADHVYFHIAQDETPCGYLSYYMQEHSIFIHMLFLDEAYRGYGIGEHILRQLEWQQRESGIESIELYVFAYNERAIKFYERLGFQIINSDIYEDRVIGHTMKKILPKTAKVGESL